MTDQGGSLGTQSKQSRNSWTWRGLSLASLVFLSGIVNLACDRTPKDPGNSQISSPSATQIPPPSSITKEKGTASRDDGPVRATGTQEPSGTEAFRLPDAERIVAIGDLHGDFSATLRAFSLAGAIDSKGAWVGGKLVVVQTGDQLDRGDDERQIIQFLLKIAKEAEAAGGAVVVLNGNHETMNVMGDFRYVTSQGMDSFESFSPASSLAVQFPSELRSRAEAFLPGGGGAQVLSERPLVVMVGPTVFVHGGVLPHHVDYGIDRLNAENNRWMRAESPDPPVLVVDPEGPVWTRLYGEPQLSLESCKILDETLRMLGAKRLVVGHTIQERGMSGACGDRVFRIDVGLSRYYGQHLAQVLQIEGEHVSILTETIKPEASGPQGESHN